LRDGVRFTNGTPFNAAAVLANARRWQSEPEGRALLLGLFAVDAPRPDVVRFLFNRPAPDVARELSHPFYAALGYARDKTQHVYSKALRNRALPREL